MGKTSARIIHWIEIAVLFVSTTTILVSMALQIFFRYVLGTALPWPEEVAKLAFVWSIMFGAAIGVRQQAHLSIEVLVRTFPIGPRRTVGRAVCLIVMATLLFMVVSGIWLTSVSTTSSLPAIGLPLAALYLPVPIGAALMLIDYARLLIDPDLQESPAEELAEKLEAAADGSRDV